MDARLHVSRLSGQATVPPSKSAAHRAVLCAALAVAVYAAGLPALLRGAEAVNKSWPAFWDTLRGLGAKIDTE